MRRLAWTLLLAASSARAGGLVVDAGSVRAIGRAGAGTVSDDGGGALLVNPAGLARRDTWRVQLGIVLADDAVTWRPANSDAPVARDQASSSTLPAIAVEGSLGGWVIGIGAQTAAASSRALASPTDFPVDSPDLLANRYQYRYAGVAGALRRDTLMVGAAHRLGDAVAIGVAVGGARVRLDETRSVWASSLAVGTGQVFERDRDVLVTASATGYAPTAVAGVLIAPTDTRVELAASVGWTAATSLDGSYRTTDPTPSMGNAAVGSTVTYPSSHLVLHEPVTVRTGVRWAGEHWIGEVGGDLWLLSSTAQAPAWRLAGLDISDEASGDTAPLTKLPSRAASQTHGALRAAIDVELIGGFLWATAGYAYTTAGTPAARLSPAFGELAGHTAAAGLEISAGDFTISLGWARTWSVAKTSASLWQHDNPFPSGDAALPTGTYDGSRDLVGLAIDAEL
ncbi:MAG: outer membrane protein transport protein [Acidobacteriota bacterium]